VEHSEDAAWQPLRCAMGGDAGPTKAVKTDVQSSGLRNRGGFAEALASTTVELIQDNEIDRLRGKDVKAVSPRLEGVP
jgi:hypothetical protein